jgi:hypothetical protein
VFSPRCGRDVRSVVREFCSNSRRRPLRIFTVEEMSSQTDRNDLDVACQQGGLAVVQERSRCDDGDRTSTFFSRSSRSHSSSDRQEPSAWVTGFCPISAAIQPINARSEWSTE